MKVTLLDKILIVAVGITVAMVLYFRRDLWTTEPDVGACTAIYDSDNDERLDCWPEVEPDGRPGCRCAVYECGE